MVGTLPKGCDNRTVGGGRRPSEVGTTFRDPGSAAPILGGMGFNPHAKTRKGPADYAMVAAALLVCLGLVAWAVLG